MNVEGEHELSPELTLRIAKSEDHQVNAFLSKGDEQVIKDLHCGSVYERWFLYWEKKSQSLWVWGTSNGGHCWYLDQRLQYQRKPIDSSSVDELPQDYWNALPSTIREIWSAGRRS